MDAFLLLLAILCFALVSGDVKTWTKNTNFDDPANWNGGALPCSNDKRVFPKDLIASIYVQKNQSLQELVLSDNMALTFAEGVVITFNDQLSSAEASRATPFVDDTKPSSVNQESTTPVPKCSSNGKVVEFSAKPSSWYNPESWSSNSDSKMFMLDMQAIPCSEDRVVFPSGNSFLVDTEESRLNVATMYIHKRDYVSQAAFGNYWKSDMSRYEFINRGRTTPTISGRHCGEDKTCSCTDRYADQIRTRVCKFRMCNKNVTDICATPIMPAYGQCCKFCGSKLRLKVNAKESPSTIGRLHTQIIDGLRDYPSVRYSLGPLISNYMEIVLRDDEGTGISANRAICQLMDLFLEPDIVPALGLVNVTFKRSDGVGHCHDDRGTTLPNSGTPSANSSNGGQTPYDTIIIVVSLAFVIICVVAVFLGVYFYRKRNGGNTKNEMELGQRTSQGFDNPVYDDPLQFEDNFTVTYDSNGDQVNGFENVLHTAGTDTGVTVHGSEKKTPLDDLYAPVVKKSKKKGNKKQKESAGVGFDNPVYKAKEEAADGMVSVPLEEDDKRLPPYVEHDGAAGEYMSEEDEGFVNPIATGLSEEMMAPSLPKKEPISTLQAAEGFDNPLFSGGNNGVAEVEAEVGEITVHVSEPTKKKKKGKNGKSKENKNKNGDASKSFDNPLYQQSDQDFYQPETPGEDNSALPEGNSP